jgi:gliding motility-associated-like protein
MFIYYLPYLKQKLLHRNFVLFFFACCFSISAVRGAHLVGGEITYRCLGNNQYEISMTVYRDCSGTGAAFDPFAPIGIFHGNTGILFTTLNIVMPGVTSVPLNSVSSCLTVPPGLCIEKTVYIDTVLLPPSPNGYDLVYQRCCRNGTITNLTNPGSAGSTYTTYIPDSTVACNNSPVFTNFPPVVLCINDPLNFDHSATDLDGDSLVYEFVTPYTGGTQFNPAPAPSAPPFGTINWGAGFTANSPLTANPGLVINPQTGMITGTPTGVGQFVVGITAKEYRNGVLINETRRDFQFNILNCLKSSAAIIDPGVICNSFTVNFGNNSVNATSYFWNFGDLATLGDTSTLVAPQYTYPDTGVYTVLLISDPTSQVCSDTMYQQVRVYPILNPFFNAPANECFRGNSFDFTAAGAYFSTTQIDWDFGPTATPALSTMTNPTGVSFSTIGVKPVEIRYRDFGCDTTFIDSIEVFISPTANFFILPNNCIDYNIQFNDLSTNATRYSWDFGVAGSSSDTSNAQNPIFNFPDSGTYTVRLIVNTAGSCSDTMVQTFRVLPKLNPNFTRPLGQCFAGNSFNFSAGGSNYNSTNISWDLGINTIPRFSNVRNPNSVTYSAPGFQVVSLTYTDFGCVNTFTDSVFVSLTPVADFSLSKKEYCIGDSIPVAFTNLAPSGLIYFWDFGDGKTSTQENPTNVYQKVGLFDVSFTVSDTIGCTDTEIKSSLVSILPSPLANFSPLDTTISSLFPHLTFVNKSQNDFVSLFNTDNGDTYSPFTTEDYTYGKDGYFYPMLVVENTIGCTDTAFGRVYVEPEYLVYVPNAFTPNDDGLNDVFKPILTEGTSYELLIFNRWGELLFQTTDVNEGWNGRYKNGEHFAPEVYVYRIEYSSPKDNGRVIQGHFTLIR